MSNYVSYDSLLYFKTKLDTYFAKPSDLNAKQDVIDATHKLSASLISGLANVATSGSYNDLSNTPTIPDSTSDLTNNSNFVSDASYVHTDNNFTSALLTKLNGIASGAEVNVQSDWNQSTTTADDYIKNKPTVYTEAQIRAFIEGYNYLTGITSAMVTTALGYTPYNSSNPSGYQTASDVQSAINSAISGITGIEFEVVQSLPATGETGVIYLLSNSGTSPNAYDEYIWLSSSSSYEKIGSTAVDLTGYWAKADLVEVTNAQIDTIFA